MTKHITVDSNIPMSGLKNRRAKYPYRDCVTVGMSFFVPNGKATSQGPINTYWSKKLKCQFSTRSTQNGKPWTKDGVVGIRVFRTQ